MKKAILSPKEVRGIESKRYKIATQLGIPIQPKAAAMILGVDEQSYITYTDALMRETQNVAEQLRQNPDVAALLDGITRLGRQVVMMGDSITACHFSYAEILQHLLETYEVNVTNWGVGGYTSIHALELCYNTALLRLRPNLIFLSYGVNDAKYFGDTPKMLVSHQEYAQNMVAVVRALQKQTAAQLVLLTPTPVIEDIANHSDSSFYHSIRWDNNDLVQFGDILKEIGKTNSVPVVDMFAAFGHQPNPQLFLEDGVHPNRAGERFMLEHIATQLEFK